MTADLIPDPDVDLGAIRDDALLGMADGPITPGYQADPTAVVAALNAMLATSVVGWLRYQQHAAVVAGLDRASLAGFFAAHARDELRHAIVVARRIVALGGTPDFDPQNLEPRSHAAYRAYQGTDITAMLRENLLAARIVIQVMQASIRRLDTADPTTRRLLESILEREESHAGDLRSLLASAS
jgi:bacterioferritin